MLEQLRHNSRSFIIWVLFGIIIAAFVLTFGSQGGLGPSLGTGPSATYAMVVGEGEVSVHAWRFGMTTLGGGPSKSLRARQVLDALLQREILAQAAEHAGIRVTTDMATDKILEGEFLVMGMPVDGRNMYFRDGLFDYERLEAQVNAMGLPNVDQFVEEQQRELQAEAMRDLLLRGSVASPEEARARFVHENTKATVDVVQFRPGDYRRQLHLSAEDVDGYLKAHESEVRAKYDADSVLYQDRGKEARIRQIFIGRKQGAVVQPGQAEGEGGGAAAAEEKPDPGLVAAREAHVKLEGGADFALLAIELSEDERTKAKGGDLGWRSVESPGLGARELVDAVASLEPGKISDVITTTRGYYILKVEDTREGDLSFEQVQREIAETMALEAYSKAAARRDAERALARAKAGVAEGKTLEDLFERQQAPPQPGLDQLPPEILEQLQRQMEQGREQGSLLLDGPDRPAEASLQGGDAPAAAGDQPAPAPAATATTAPAGNPAQGSAAAPAATVPEDIPVPLDLVEPQVRRVGPFTRDPEGMILGVGKAEELMAAIFGELTGGQLAEQVYEVSETFVVVQLVSRQEPNLEDFEESRTDRVMNLGLERGYRNLRAWVQSRCEAMVEARHVGINQELMNQLATEKEGEVFTYQPNCAGI